MNFTWFSKIQSWFVSQQQWCHMHCETNLIMTVTSCLIIIKPYHHKVVFACHNNILINSNRNRNHFDRIICGTCNGVCLQTIGIHILRQWEPTYYNKRTHMNGQQEPTWLINMPTFLGQAYDSWQVGMPKPVSPSAFPSNAQFISTHRPWGEWL